MGWPGGGQRPLGRARAWSSCRGAWGTLEPGAWARSGPAWPRGPQWRASSATCSRGGFLVCRVAASLFEVGSSFEAQRVEHRQPPSHPGKAGFDAPGVWGGAAPCLSDAEVREPSCRRGGSSACVAAPVTGALLQTQTDCERAERGARGQRRALRCALRTAHCALRQQSRTR